VKYRISKPARLDLDDIWRYTETNWGIRQADHHVDALLARLAWLTINKSMWRERQEVGEGLYSYNQERHVIFFRGSSEAIEIVRVLHTRMDIGGHLK
jgi:toxin ParE1/3/4